MINVPVFFASDDNYVGPLSVAIESLKENRNKENTYNIYVLTTGLKDSNVRNLKTLEDDGFTIEIVDANQYLERIKDELSIRDYYSYSTYLRFFIPNMFPDIDKGIYLDSDLVINTDISMLYEMDFGMDYLCASVDDVVPQNEVFKDYTRYALGIEPEKYFNAGILLMNLELMREEKLFYKFIEMSKRRKFPVAQDQDFLNVLCYSKVGYLDKSWNKIAMYEDSFMGEPKIVHYKLSYKPWHYKNVMYEDLFWKYAKNTPYYEKMIYERDNYNGQEKDKAGGLNLLNLASIEIGKARIASENYSKQIRIFRK